MQLSQAIFQIALDVNRSKRCAPRELLVASYFWGHVEESWDIIRNE
jgi:hypothetical protein